MIPAMTLFRSGRYWHMIGAVLLGDKLLLKSRTVNRFIEEYRVRGRRIVDQLLNKQGGKS